MQIITEETKTYFIYSNHYEADKALDRLKHLKPHLCCRDGYFNAVVVDMRYVQEQGEA